MAESEIRPLIEADFPSLHVSLDAVSHKPKATEMVAAPFQGDIPLFARDRSRSGEVCSQNSTCTVSELD